jgi:hypothetical protein
MANYNMSQLSLYMPGQLQEVEAPRIPDNRHMKVAKLSALQTERLSRPGDIPWYSFVLRAESTPGP